MRRRRGGGGGAEPLLLALPAPRPPPSGAEPAACCCSRREAQSGSGAAGAAPATQTPPHASSSLPAALAPRGARARPPRPLRIPAHRAGARPAPRASAGPAAGPCPPPRSVAHERPHFAPRSALALEPLWPAELTLWESGPLSSARFSSAAPSPQVWSHVAGLLDLRTRRRAGREDEEGAPGARPRALSRGGMAGPGGLPRQAGRPGPVSWAHLGVVDRPALGRRCSQ
nr:uncharacterized protein LOC127493663 [Oryctolagus cuniculus]